MAKFVGNCVWLLLSGVVGALLLIVGKYVAIGQLDEQIRTYVETRLVEHYSGLDVSVRDARRIAGEGIEIRGISIRLPAAPGRPAQELAFIDEILAKCDTDLSQIVRGRVDVSQLVVRRARVNAVRGADGRWNVQNLWPLPRFGPDRPALALEDGIVLLTDSTRPERMPCVMRDIHATLGDERDASTRLKDGGATAGDTLLISGSLTGNHFDRGRFSARLAANLSRWSASGTLDGLNISRRVLEDLPGKAAEHLAPLANLQARAQVDFKITSNARAPEGELPFRFAVSGTLSEGRVDSRDLPLPLSHLRAQVYCDNDGLRVDRLEARAGNTDLRGSLQCGFDERSLLILRLNARNLPLDGRLAELYPEKLDTIWQRLSPSGTVHCDLSVVAEGDRTDTELYLECANVAFTYDKFPYRLNQARGIVHYKGGTLTIEEGFHAHASDQVLHLSGSLQSINSKPMGWFEIRADGPIPLDHQLIAALDAKPRQVLQSLQPSGKIMLNRARFERQDRTGPMHKHLDISVQDGTVRYEKFPYPLSGIEGRLLVDDDRWLFQGLRGYNGSAYVVCQGSWTSSGVQGGLLELDFVAHDVPCEDELRDALRPDIARMWTSLRPRGTLDRLSIALRYDNSLTHPVLTLDVDAEKWPPQQNIAGRTLSIEPVWFPYQLNEVTGSAHFRNGSIELNNISAMHGKTRVKVAGRAGIYPDGRWSLEFNRLTADHVELDRALLAALPRSLSRPLSKLQFEGPLNLYGMAPADQGEDALAFQLQGYSGDPRQQARWNVAVDVYDGRLALGIPLEHIQGTVHLQGASDRNGFRSAGQLELDSLHIKQAQVTQIRGPFWIDQSHIAFGSQAQADPASGPSPLSGQLFDGILTADAFVSLEDDQKFALLMNLREADLGKITRSTTGRAQDLSGVAAAQVQLHGSTHGVHTLGGGGVAQLRDADIYELPVMVSLLKLLSIRPPDTTAFNTSDIHFRFEGDQMYFDRIDFNGDAISLKGRGQMDLKGQMDLSFYTVVGRQELQLPLPRALLGEASRQIFEIQVTGTLDEPNVQRTAFPGWNETLQQLFPEVTRNDRPRLLRMATPGGVLGGGLLRK